MATVYLARDLKHDRDVAVKVLRPELAAALGAARFLAEIKTTANLQHPHILPLHDSGEANGSLFYVMPFVQGESLRERLARERQLPIDDAVQIAREVADALGYAHERGVVHRDVKPENILLQGGHALVADFGIALAVQQAGGQRMTQTGLSLGTPQYMSPEQAMGERVIDARCDIYALGVVLYEMLAGEPPFTGPTVQATLARVMTERPRSLTAQRPSVPVYVEAAVFKAIEKLPADRFSTARHFADALAGSGAFVARPVTRRAGTRAWALSAVAALTVLAATGIGWLIGRRNDGGGATSYPPSRLAIVGPRFGGTGVAALQRQLTLTPDGETLLYLTLAADGHTQLMRQRLDALEPAPVANVRTGTTVPFFSPDGKWFAGWVTGERDAYRYAFAGGSSERLSLMGGYTGFVQWDQRGTIWFSPTNGGSILRLDEGDSLPRDIGPRSRGLRLQQVLPDGRHVLAMRRAVTQSGPAVIFDMNTGEMAPLMPAAVVEVRYANGYVIFVLPDGTLQAAPFDEATRRVTGAAVTIGTNVSNTGTGIAQFAVAQNGTIAYIVEEPQSLVFVDRSGTARAALDALHNYHGPRFSPDGRQLAFDFNSADGRDVWRLSIGDGTLARATFDHDGHDVTWTPDGHFITYLSARSGTEAIYRKRPSGTEPAEALFTSRQLGFTGMWVRDGSAILPVMNDMRPGSGSDVAIVRNGGRGSAEPIVATEFAEGYPALSPDSRWLAFTSDQSGRPEVYVRPLSGTGDQVQVSLDGGTEAVWAPSGTAVFYRTTGQEESRLVEARVRTVPSFSVLSRAPLFSVADMIGTNPHANYDISPDGRTFVMVRRSPATRIMVIQNLPALVRHLSGSDAAR
jgi:serine/threonine-protein kinase